MYITTRRRTVCLGSLQGLYESFLKRNLTGIVHLHKQDSTGFGPFSIFSSMGATVVSISTLARVKNVSPTIPGATIYEA